MYEALPRARGGISINAGSRGVCDDSSPRTRGYFRVFGSFDGPDGLFPAHAGVFPTFARCRAMSLALPRARGGISYRYSDVLVTVPSSPRTRGYFRLTSNRTTPHKLFPAHAGVFPTIITMTTTSLALPRARGGISGRAIPPGRQRSSSPRTRGYFLI